LPVRKGGNLATCAAMLVIGDEILNGATSDENTAVATKTLGGIGIPLQRVVIVRDNETEIANEVKDLSERYDVLITSGGIGPTHDDVTIKAVASAFSLHITENKQMISHLLSVRRRQRYQLSQVQASTGEVSITEFEKKYEEVDDVLSDEMRRLALLPSSSRLRFQKPVVEGSWPVLQVNNVFVLPGIPQFFASKMNIIADSMLIAREVPVIRRVLLSVEECTVVSSVDDVVKQHSNVKLGSYPYIDNPEYKTVITLEGKQTAVIQAIQSLREKIPSRDILRIEDGTASTT